MILYVAIREVLFETITAERAFKTQEAAESWIAQQPLDKWTVYTVSPVEVEE